MYVFVSMKYGNSWTMQFWRLDIYCQWTGVPSTLHLNAVRIYGGSCCAGDHANMIEGWLMQEQPILNRLLHRTHRRLRTTTETLATYRSNTHRLKGTDNSIKATIFVWDVQQIHTMATSWDNQNEYLQVRNDAKLYKSCPTEGLLEPDNF